MSSAAKHVSFTTSLQLGGMSPKARLSKRALDLVLSAVLLVLLCPLILILALLIRIQDGGPGFYRRRVVGLRRNFDAFKLRTMRVDADEILKSNPELQRNFEVNFKLKSDPRITKLGAVLRKISLDELPQLWNVVKGEMSLVGPRMICPAELDKYGDTSRIFHCFKPGITGYWQIQARQQVSYDERVEMDLFYVTNWSFLLDLKILLQTPGRVIRGTGAY